MKKRLLLLSLSSLVFASTALAGYVVIGHVPMPELTSSEWAMIHRQQGPNPQIIPVDVNLAVNHGVVYAVSIRGEGTGYPDIDRTIVRWIANKWSTDNWFRGGDSYVVSLGLDPVTHQVVFRKNYGNNYGVRLPLTQKLNAKVGDILQY
jgi:hypothetical protein